jgi:hypothetical protein
MEKQFNILLNDYRDNYIQYKSNGNEHYKSAYESAQTAIGNLFNEANNLPEKTLDTSDLEMRVIRENDNRVGAEMRKPHASFAPQQYSYRTQYIIIGSLAAAIALLIVKPWSLIAQSS